MSEPDDTPPNWPTIHYDFREQRPAQHEPGERAPEPVSHIQESDIDNIIVLIQSTRELFYTARRPHNDARWPRYRAGLLSFRPLVRDALAADPGSETLQDYLWWINHFVGAHHPSPAAELPQ